MKTLLLALLVTSCAVLKNQNVSRVKVGMSDKDFTDDFIFRETKDVAKYRFYTLYDGIIVSNRDRIVEKYPTQAKAVYKGFVSAVSLVENQKFKYFIKAEARYVDPTSILFQAVIPQVKMLMTLNGEEVVDNENEATAILYVGYAITTFITRSNDFGPLLQPKTEYKRILNLIASKKEAASVNLWETRLESIGPSNDLAEAVPGMLALASDNLNKNLAGIQEVEAQETNVALNLITNPRMFEKYVR